MGCSLVHVYAKCGSMEDAQRVFNKMPSRDVATWTAMISGHVKCGQEQKALEVFQQMQQEGVWPNSVTFVGVVNAGASLAALEEGRRAHEQIIQSGWDSNVFVGLAWLTCMPNVGAWRMLRECSRRCHHAMCSLGPA